MPNVHEDRSSLLVVLVAVFVLSPSSIRSKNSDRTPYYDVCAPFVCGGINFTFPFSNISAFGLHRLDCGLPGAFLVSCDQSLDQPSIQLVTGRLYRVKEFFAESFAMTVVDYQLSKDLSLPSFSTSSNSCSILEDYINFPARDAGNADLRLLPGAVSQKIWICDPQVGLPSNILVIANSTCNEVNSSGDNRRLGVYALFTNYTSKGSIIGAGDPPQGCRPSVELPVTSDVIQNLSLSFNSSAAPDERRWTSFVDVMREYGMPLVWSPIPKCDECLAKNGRCGFEAGDSVGAVCFYKGTSGKKGKWKIIVSATTGCSSLIILSSLAYNLIKRRKSSIEQNNGRARDARQFIKSYQSTLLTSFSFREIKKITDGFKDKLGEGGFGSVYKGKLPDGRVVAVKLLDRESSRGTPHDSQDFINEVRTIGTIHHVNIIRLHGFCVDHARQALVYEYMQNGSLGDVLRSGGYHALGTDVMMKIALGVAEGVNYLHRGCDSRILHLDIKPQNILLDEGYNPKVSDFGLAKVYSRSRSAITMSEAKGTIGFIAPEMILRNLGNPSDRSDVYSFGMVLLEMIGARKRVNKTITSSSSSTERYFPDWIYEELNHAKATEIETADEGENISFTRKMIMVGLWCIQIKPNDRPSMARVLEMLLGKEESIAMPPKPLFFGSSKNLLRTEKTEGNTSEVVESVLVSSHNGSE